MVNGERVKFGERIKLDQELALYVVSQDSNSNLRKGQILSWFVFCFESIASNTIKPECSHCF